MLICQLARSNLDMVHYGSNHPAPFQNTNRSRLLFGYFLDSLFCDSPSSPFELPADFLAFTMRNFFLLSFSLLASTAVGVLASEDLKIDVTLPIECDRKTRKGDVINVHYKGTLKSNGQKFDSS